MKIALIGCGTVGGRIGRGVLGSGHALTVHDVDRSHAEALLEAGASWAARPAELGPTADAVVSCLPREEDIARVCSDRGGVWYHVRRGTIHIETATVGPAFVRRLAEAARERGIRFLDAPLSRGAPSASGPALVAYVGGDADVFDMARPVLDAFAARTVYCGGVGQGQVAKLVNNLIAHTMAVVVGEALAAGVRAGASLDILRNALHEGTAQSRVLDDLLPVSVFRGEWRPGLRLDLARRDLELAAGMAAEAGVDPALLEPVRALYDAAAERGWNGLTAHAVLRLIEEAAGVELRSPILQSIRLPPGTDST
jgi:3-hydroxyisobutyrate dehydrogenase-like beta-hydroxyacid dehydrogenase